MTAIQPQAGGGGFAGGWGRFRRWRRSRPFWGGLFTLLGGVWIFGTTQLSLGGLSFQMGPTGFLSWLIPTILVACGLLVWFTPHQRLFYSIIAAVTAVYSLIGVNLGGFFLGMLLALIGAALGFAWTPVPAPASAADTEERPLAPDARGPVDGDDRAYRSTVDELLAGPITDGPPEPDRRVEPDRWVEPQVPAPPHRPEIPAADDAPPPRRGPGLYSVVLIAVALSAVGAVTLSPAVPAHADPCPIARPAPPAAGESGDGPGGGKRPAETPTGKPTASPSARPSPSPTGTPRPAGEQSPNPVGDFVSDVVDGFKDLLGIEGEGGQAAAATPAPGTPAPGTPTATPAPAAATPGTPTPGTPTPRTPTPGTPAAGPDPAPAPEPTSGPTARPRSTGRPAVESVDDLAGCTRADLQQPGPAVRLAAEPGQPLVSRPSRLTGSRVSMFGLSYDGVVDLPTADGTIRALLFSMERSVTDDFELVVPSGGGKTVSLRSSALTVEGNVKFYASRFSGTLLGIPLTFTPDSPPPITLPIMIFGKPDMQLVFVDCETLRAPSLDMSAAR